MTNSNMYQSKLSVSLKNNVVVVDTSSLLMAGKVLLKALNNCTLVIPAIVVKELEEQRTQTTIGYFAREWLRFLEELRENHGKELSNGVLLEKYDSITLRIEPNHRSQDCLPKHLQDGSRDSTILSVAKNLADEIKEKEVVLLSNDVPMRIHATLDLDIQSYEFNANAIVKAQPFDGCYTVEVSEQEYSDYLNENNASVILSKLPENHAKRAVVKVLFNDDSTVLNTFLYDDGRLSEVNRKTRSSNIVARTLEQDVAMNYLSKPYDDVSIVSIHGKAGGGKTLVTLAVALDELKKGHYQKIMVFRSLHEMGQGQEMGFLPGDVNEKMGAWAGAIHDAIDVLAAAKKPLKKNAGPHAETALQNEAERLRKMIEVSPITYLRGRSLANTFIILEEAQNFSRSEILNILSRAGEGSKIVLTFDDDQVDNRFLQSGSKADIWSVVESLKSERIFAHITLKHTERSYVAEVASRLLAES